MKAFLQKLFFFVAAGLFLFQLPLLTPVLAGNPPDQNNSSMLISTGTVLANGSATFTITITLKDSGGNILTGDTVSLSASDGSVNISPSSTTLNGSGQATFTLNSNNPATSTLTIHDTTTSNAISRSDWVITFAPTPTQQPTPTPIGTCNDATPAAPQITSAEASGAHSVVLTWNAVAAPVSYYLVSYGISSGNYIYGNPDVGNVTSYTVGSLSTGKTYYFAVKAVNGCMSGAYSNEMSGVPGASTPTPTVSASGTDVSATDQTSQSELTNPSLSDTPSPTEGPPITPVPKAGAASAGRVAVFAVIGVLLVASVVVLILVNKSGKKPGQRVPPITSRQPPPMQEPFGKAQGKTSDIFHQPNGIDPEEPVNPPNDQSLS